MLCIRGNGIIHRAHKEIQGDDCRPRRSSWVRFPWLTPIPNSFKLRVLYSSSYFGPRTCVGGITNVIEVGGVLNQGFPFSPLMSHFRGLRDSVEYKFLDCIPHRHQWRDCNVDMWWSGYPLLTPTIQAGPSGKNMWRHHTTLNFDHTEKWCHYTILVWTFIYFNTFVWSHHLMFDHTIWNMDT